MSNNYEIIGNNLKRIRKRKGLSQDDVAAKCKTVDRAKISKIENARVDYMISTLFDYGRIRCNSKRSNRLSI